MSMRMIMPNVGDDMEQLAHSYIAGSSVIGTSTLENSLQYLLKLNMPPCDLAILPDKYTQKISAPILPMHKNNNSHYTHYS